MTELLFLAALTLALMQPIRQLQSLLYVGFQIGRDCGEKCHSPQELIVTL